MLLPIPGALRPAFSKPDRVSLLRELAAGSRVAYRIDCKLLGTSWFVGSTGPLRLGDCELLDQSINQVIVRRPSQDSFPGAALGLRPLAFGLRAAAVRSECLTPNARRR